MCCVHLAVLGAVSGGLASSAHEWLLQRLGAVIAQRDISKAIKYHGLDIAKEVGDRAGEGQAYANLGTSHMHLNEATCT